MIDVIRIEFEEVDRSFKEGIVFWLYSSNRKIFFSSKTFRLNTFHEHDSFYFGKIDEWFKEDDQQYKSLKKLLKGRERIFGYTLGKKNRLKGKLEVYFFSSWNEMISHGKIYFSETIEDNEFIVMESLSPIETRFVGEQINLVESHNSVEGKWERLRPTYFEDNVYERDNLISLFSTVDKSNMSELPSNLKNIINEVSRLDTVPNTADIIIKNGWKIVELLTSRISISRELNDLSRVIVSAYINNGDVEDALEWVNEISKKGYKLDNIKGNLENIIKYQKGRHILDIRDNQTLNCIGSFHRELKAFNKAKSIFLRALELEPKSTYSLTQLGRLCRDAGWYQEGISFYNEAIAIKVSKYPYNGLGAILKDNGNLIQARDAFLLSLELDDRNNVAAHSGIGSVYIKLGQFDDAAWHFNLAGEDPIKYLIDEYYVNKKIKLIDKAIRCLEYILKLQPHNRFAEKELYHHRGS
jgi:pentatricopeptide repeat protein